MTRHQLLSGLSSMQRVALEHPCLLQIERVHPRFRQVGTLLGRRVLCVLTVSRGYDCVELKFGGPVWHVMLSAPGSDKMPEHSAAELFLDEPPVGNFETGQWYDKGGTSTAPCLHVRRRLTEAEVQVSGPVEDVRGTPRATQRWQDVREYLPPGFPPE